MADPETTRLDHGAPSDEDGHTADRRLARRSWITLVAGYGALVGLVAATIGIGVTRLMVGPDGGTAALTVFLIAVGATAAAAAVAGGPLLLRLESGSGRPATPSASPAYQPRR